MVAAVKFNAFPEALAEKKHDLGADTLKVLLTNTLPVAATAAVKADITEIAAGNGYTAGGFALTRISSSQTGGTYSLKVNDIAAAFTATGGNVGPFQYAVLYNDTAAAKDLICYWDLGAPTTVTTGNTFPFDVIPADGTIITF